MNKAVKEKPKICRISIFESEEESKDGNQTARQSSAKTLEFKIRNSQVKRKHSVEEKKGRKSRIAEKYLKPPPGRYEGRASQLKHETKKKSERLSFSKNQHLNFIFGNQFNQPTESSLPPSEEPTPRINALPQVATINVALEPTGTPQETYEEIDMRTENSYKSEAQDEAGDLSAVKKKLNEFAQQLCCKEVQNQTVPLVSRDLEEPEKTANSMQFPRSVLRLGSPKEDASPLIKESQKNQEIAEKMMKKLIECKGNLRVFQNFAREIQQIEKNSNISERERVLKTKLALSQVQKIAQSLQMDSLEMDIDSLKQSLILQTNSMTTTETTVLGSAHTRQGSKYQMQVGKLQQENSILQKQIEELEEFLCTAVPTKKKSVVKKDKTRWSLIDSKENRNVQQEKSINYSIIKQENQCDQEIKTIIENYSSALKELQLSKLAESKMLNRNDELLSIIQEKDKEIARLKTLPTHSSVCEHTSSVSLSACSNSARQTALGSLFLLKSHSITQDLLYTPNVSTPRYDHCLEQIQSLKTASQSVLQALKRTAIEGSSISSKEIENLIGDWAQGPS